MKVLIVCSGDWLERWASFIEAIGEKDSVELTVATTKGNSFTMDRIQKLNDAGIKTVMFKSIPGKWTGFEASTVYGKGIGNLIRSGFDAVHFIAEASYIGTYQFLRSIRKLAPETVTTIRAAQNVVKHFPYPFKKIEEYSYQQFDAIIPLFKDQEEVLRQKGYLGKTYFIGNGFDHHLFRPSETAVRNEPYHFGFVGYFEHYKGIYTLLNALKILENENFKLTMIAKGNEKEQFLQQAEKMNIQDKIHVQDLIPQTRLPEFLNQIDALILPSEEAYYLRKNKLKFMPKFKPHLVKEQFGRVLVEAMACRKVVIGSTCGGIPQVIGDAGLIFRQKNPKELAAKMKLLIDDEQLNEILQAKAFEKANTDYTWDKIASKYVGVWEELIQKRG
ncbi:glycosyltransferase [Planomicrobium okeanokoites]|uniref:glycosyltransferase n=1 Tax=Planomicrobium okeanokoites TaxID=244 RepID=UPI0030F9B589